MKFAFMTFSCPDLDLDQVLAMAREFGYDGIEPRVSANHQHGVEFEITGNPEGPYPDFIWEEKFKKEVFTKNKFAAYYENQ